jgi:NTE family protein
MLSSKQKTEKQSWIKNTGGKTVKETILVLQNIGSMGAYECGVYKAIEENGIRPDAVVGSSMGAVNAAIIASHEIGKAADAVGAFWSEIGILMPSFSHDGLRQLMASFQAMMMGVPKVFIPRWLIPSWNSLLPTTWISFYDRRPLRRLLEKYVDFKFLPTSHMRLLMTAVNVETAEVEIFDSRSESITADHIIACGSIPPMLPWTPIRNKLYWDGTLLNGTSLRPVLERMILEAMVTKTEIRQKKVYLVDPFSNAKPRPQNMLQVIDRQKAIFLWNKVQNDMGVCQLVNDTLVVVKNLLDRVDDDVARQLMNAHVYKRLMRHCCWVDLTRIDRPHEVNGHYLTEYDFSRQTIQEQIALGYHKAREVLAKEPSGGSDQTPTG